LPCAIFLTGGESMNVTDHESKSGRPSTRRNLLPWLLIALLIIPREVQAEPVSIACGIIALGTAAWSGGQFLGGTQSFAFAEADAVVDSDPAGATRQQIAADTYAVRGGWATANAKTVADTGVTAKGTRLKTESESDWQGPVTKATVTFPEKQRGNQAGWYFWGYGAALGTFGWTVNKVPGSAPGAGVPGDTEIVPIDIRYTVDAADLAAFTGDGSYMDITMGLTAYAVPGQMSPGQEPQESSAFWQQSLLSGEVTLIGGAAPSRIVTGNILADNMFSPLSTSNDEVTTSLNTPVELNMTVNVEVPSTLTTFSFLLKPKALGETLQSTPDYNGDDNIDAADYVNWRKFGINGEQGYSTWRTNFGAILPGSGATAGSVPEPGAGVLILLSVFLLAVQPWRRHVSQ
jgi:hypothetical protein